MLLQIQGKKRTFIMGFAKEDEDEVDAGELLQVLGGCFETADYIVDGVDVRFGFRGQPVCE